jgi:biotin carboxyl carrier protein
MRTFVVTLEPATQAAGASSAPAAPAGGTPVHSTFAGSVEVVDLLVKQGHDIKSPVAGQVTAIHVKIGDEIDSSNPIMTIA